MIGLLATKNMALTITGDKSLSQRPMLRILGPLTEMGANFSDGYSFLDDNENQIKHSYSFLDETQSKQENNQTNNFNNNNNQLNMALKIPWGNVNSH